MRPTTLIDLGRGYAATVYSDTHERLRLGNYRWHALVARGGRYVYAVAYRGEQVYLHRLIAGEDAEKVDHKDRDTLNNRDDNLRRCTSSQNSMNLRHRHNSSGLKGVHWAPTSRGWTAKVTAAGVRYYLGVFKHKRRAGIAVDRAALALHGEFANLNFPNRRTRAIMPTNGRVLKRYK